MGSNSLEYTRRYREANRERHNARARAWRQRNPDKAAAATKRSRAVRREEYRARQRKDWRASRRFVVRGITAEWFRDQLVGQAGRCAICWAVFDSDRNTHVDHDHQTGQIRALLCSRCNLMLGIAQDSTGVLASAIAYLGSFAEKDTRTEGP